MLAVAEHKGIRSELIPRIATGFCGGLAHTGGNCGAVSGGVLSIGLYLGRNSPAEFNRRCYEAVRKFMGQFSKRFGALGCPQLIGVQLGTPEGQAAFHGQGADQSMHGLCRRGSRVVVELVG